MGRGHKYKMLFIGVEVQNTLRKIEVKKKTEDESDIVSVRVYVCKSVCLCVCAYGK